MRDVGPDDLTMNVYEKATIAFEAGTIEHKLLSAGRFTCLSCKNVFLGNVRISFATATNEKCTEPCESKFEFAGLRKSILKFLSAILTSLTRYYLTK